MRSDLGLYSCPLSIGLDQLPESLTAHRIPGTIGEQPDGILILHQLWTSIPDIPNIPGYVTTNPNSQSNYEKKEAVRNYEINETKEKVVAAPGSIRRLAVAVLVDESVTPLQQDSLSRTVSSAVGINQTRGDVLSVERLPFSTELADKQKQEEEDFKRQQAQAMWMKIGLVLLLAGTLFAIIRLYLKRKQREREMEEMQQMLAMDEAADMVGAEAELSPEERRRQEQRQAIEQMAKSRPEDIAQMLKAWLTDE